MYPEGASGHSVYTRFTLAVYDWYMLGVSNRFVWKCPTERLVAHFDRHVTDNHLDVGVGTGYFLDVCRFPSDTPRIGLLDLNPCSLARTSQRIARYKPEVFWRNALEPIELNGDRYDSISLNYVLHCLPGTMQEKAVVFDHLRKHLNPGGTLFGSTLLHTGVTRTPVARRLMNLYNRKRIFSNRDDDLEQLKAILEERFPHSGIEIVGCAALFWARA
ncbi:Methyltransferase domain-containing protein [Thiohalomonas denitrificans]|uniref:Methyltransferase domain-containing protein n=2 Tax=Thiohalomonas denitrificans TaxID=415747 RepID=A0A1G5QBH5_9GAMM|nr:Methyltransferase domain-containing protein [Thiohalomonas denitrificans]